MPTEIVWTDETWNPTVGCSRISPGCDRCYAIRVAAREMQPAHVGITTPSKWKNGRVETPADWTGEVRQIESRLTIPFRWRKPRRVFVDSMSDLFHPDVPQEFIGAVWHTMRATPQHTYQILTKRPQRMRDHVPTLDTPPLPNVWLGTSVETQRYADLRIPHLLATPAAVRFLSVEPLLGAVDLDRWLTNVGRCQTCGGSASVPVDGGGTACPDCFDDPNGQGAHTTRAIDWVIVGGESGPGARPMHPDWARSVRDQCVAAGVPFLFKQWGEYAQGHLPTDAHNHPRAVRIEPDGTLLDWVTTPPGHPSVTMSRVGKKAAGRTLDGRTWDEYPA